MLLFAGVLQLGHVPMPGIDAHTVRIKYVAYSFVSSVKWTREVKVICLHVLEKLADYSSMHVVVPAEWKLQE